MKNWETEKKYKYIFFHLVFDSCHWTELQYAIEKLQYFLLFSFHSSVLQIVPLSVSCDICVQKVSVEDGEGVVLIYGASCFWQQPAKSRHFRSLGFQSTIEAGLHFKWACVCVCVCVCVYSKNSWNITPLPTIIMLLWMSDVGTKNLICTVKAN